MRRVLREFLAAGLGVAAVVAVLVLVLRSDPLMDGVGDLPWVALAIAGAGVLLAEGCVRLVLRLTRSGGSRRIRAAMAAAGPGALREVLEAGGLPPARAVRLSVELMRRDLAAGPGDLARDAARFVSLARDPATDPAAAAWFAGVIAGNEAEALVFGRSDPPLLPGGSAGERLAAAEELLALAETRRPGDPFTAAALGIVRLAQGRPAEARELLAVRLRGRAFAASVVAIRAVVAAELGEHEEARRLLGVARRAAAAGEGRLADLTVREAGARVEG